MLARCVRCHTMYDEFAECAPCKYHPGSYGNHNGNIMHRTWSCCGAHDDRAVGCTTSNYHERCETTQAALDQFGGAPGCDTTGMRRRGHNVSGDTAAVETIKPALPPKGVPAHAILYSVGVGDTLASIALRHGMSVTQLKKWNKLLSPNVYAGQQLHVVPPSAPTPEQKRSDDLRKLMKRGKLQPEEAAYYLDEAAGDVERAWAALCADNAAVTAGVVVGAEDEGWLHVDKATVVIS